MANNPDLGYGDPKVEVDAAHRFANLLGSTASPNLRSAFAYFESEDHNSVPLLSLHHGLLHIFEGYKPSLANLLNEPSVLNIHFQRISEQLGVDLLPPEAFVHQLGEAMLHQIKNFDKAIALFKLNVSNYPTSYKAYEGLGDAHRSKGETTLAIENYEESLRLNPENQTVLKQVQALKGQ